MRRPIADVQELRSIQLGILDDIASFCDRHGIRYSLCGGTLIGALRHKGYIPWDDDIDLYMMRSEYERFLALYNKEKKAEGAPYELLSPEATRDYLYSFGKVIDTRTVMQEDETEGYEIGVFVDIFPIDYACDGEAARQRQFTLMYLLYKLRRCKRSRKCFLRSRVAYYAYKFAPIPLCLIEWLERKYVFLRRPTSLICNMHNNRMPITMAFPAATMQHFTELEFEGKRYKAMADYETYLSHTYKFHYMTLPPEDQRIRHHFKAWWKN